MKSNSSDNRSVAYIGVSTKGQDEKFSPEVQEDSCRQYAKDQNLRVIKEFREARSGWKLNARVEFYKMLEFIKTQDISDVIFAFGDRISRNTEDYVLLKGTRVRFHNAISGTSFDPNDPNDFEETAAFEHDQVDAKKSSAKTRKKVIESQNKKVLRGEYPAAPPLGYVVVPKLVDGKWKNETIIDPDRGHFITRMFELYGTGDYTLRAITEKMKNLGLRSKRGRVLTHEEIRRYLKTEFYYGYFRWGGKLHSNRGADGKGEPTYQPLISKALFDAVQEVLAGRNRAIRWGRDFKYKGLLVCDFCGCALVGDEQPKTLKSGENKVYIYYHCTSGKPKEFYQEKYGRDRCPLYSKPYYTEQEIDKYLEFAIQSFYIDPQIYEWIRHELGEDYENLKQLNGAEIESLRREHSRIESQESSLIELIAESQAPAKAKLKALYEKRLEEQETRKAEIEIRLEKLQNGEEAVSLKEIEDTLELSKALKDKYLAALPEQRRKLNNLIFRNIVVTKKGWLPGAGADDKHVTATPFYPVLNEPFRTLWEIDFIQGMEEAKARLTPEQKASPRPKVIIGGADET